MQSLFLGVDTSNYTTSLALIGQDGSLIANLKRPLFVQNGAHGLRQSDAVFSHVKNFPSLIEEADSLIGNSQIIAVGVSIKPRNIENSYMPCFLSGRSFAHSIALGSHAPLFEFSHQCGHIMAALYSSGHTDWCNSDFGAFHISGGTTEVLHVEKATDYHGFHVQLVGGSKDLNAGQVIDRVGVYMGIPFPCGIEMEKLALSHHGKIPKRKIKIEDGFVNLSGLENLACKMYDETKAPSLCAAFVFETLAETFQGLCQYYCDVHNQTPVVFSGGVMSNQIIRSRLEGKFNCAFAAPELSRDNAVGIAELTRRQFLKNHPQ